MNPVLKSMTSLVQLSLNTIVDNLNNILVKNYYYRWRNITYKHRPKFGPFRGLRPSYLMLIIEELIKRELLEGQHLRVLLPECTERLTCDENTKYSLFNYDTISFISFRCPKFKMLHYHIGLQEKYKDKIFLDAIPRLKCLQEINFLDALIPKGTLLIIALNCPQLRELNLCHTNLSDVELKHLIDEKSVLKNSLTKLNINKTIVSSYSILQCLLNFKNLTHFESDRTIDASLFLFDALNRSGAVSNKSSKFQTNIYRTKIFESFEPRLTDEVFKKWLVQMFPKIKHLTISFDEKSEEFVTDLVKSWKNITVLELSSSECCHYIGLESIFKCCENLITLKLENFICENFVFLARKLKQLEKLFLINNCYYKNEENEPFENLKEVEIITFEDKRKNCFESEEDYMMLPDTLLFSILSSKKLEKVLIYNQEYLTSDLLINLLNTGNLKSLKHLKVFLSPLGKVAILEIFCQTIPIKEIVIGFCYITKKEADKIYSYIKDNNLAFSFTIVMENLYGLQWIPLDEIFIFTHVDYKCSK